MSDAAVGQIIAVVVLGLVLGALYVLPRKRATGDGGPNRPSFLFDLIVGKDNRVSTSQCVALTWTFAIVYLIVAAMVTMWVGDGRGWHSFTGQNIGPYLVFLGGPYAAGVLAKASAVKTAQSGAKTPSTDPPTASQLVTDDSGETDLGDFQYVLFNAIAIAFVIVSFVGHLPDGLPVIPQVLWALAITSAGGYTAKKLITDPLPSAQAPTGTVVAPLVAGNGGAPGAAAVVVAPAPAAPGAAPVVAATAPVPPAPPAPNN